MSTFVKYKVIVDGQEIQNVSFLCALSKKQIKNFIREFAAMRSISESSVQVVEVKCLP